MGNTIRLKPVEATPRVFRYLEQRGRIRTFRPVKKALRVKPEQCVVEKVYSSASRFGSHKLICVGKNVSVIELNSHPDNEEFLIINTTAHTFKPLYLIVGLHKHAVIEKKARNGALTNRDFITIRLRYNNPKTSLFTMLKYTPHCEVTSQGRGKAPVFFVTEPNKFRMDMVNLSSYTLSLLGRNSKK